MNMGSVGRWGLYGVGICKEAGSVWRWGLYGCGVCTGAEPV